MNNSSTQNLDDATIAKAWDAYSESLLRKVAAQALKLRRKLPASELRDQLSCWTENTPKVDRQLKSLSLPARALLALLQVGKRQLWHIGTMLELVSCLRTPATPHHDGLKIVEELFLNGFLVPILPRNASKLSSFEDWLSQGLSSQFQAWVSSHSLKRAATLIDLLPSLDDASEMPASARESDGLEWFLRLSVLWQQVHDVPHRLTQQGAFFKRDHDRLLEDPLLNQPAADQLAPLPQPGHFLVCLGLGIGLFEIEETVLYARPFPESWRQGRYPANQELLAAASEMKCWSVADGWRGRETSLTPWSSAQVILLGLLLRLEVDSWISIQSMSQWLADHHCYWSELDHKPDLTPQVAALLLGWLFPLRIIQAAQTEAGQWVVRLSADGRSILSGQQPPPAPEFLKTILVQPNLEMIAYRQGLQPALIAGLSSIATWLSIGAACTLVIDQSSVHRGTQDGSSLESMRSLLERHNSHDLPRNVVESLRTWTAKRDRLTVYPRSNLLEFLTAEDLDLALSRGIRGVRISERYLLIENEDDLDFRHFRTLGSRDYALAPTVCVNVAEDGVSLFVDENKSDLLLETELQRFSLARLDKEQRLFQITPESLSQARTNGLTMRYLETWFAQRTGQSIPAAVKLLWSDRNGSRLQISREIVLTVTDETVAQGLWQWPETRQFLHDRLGPTSFRVNPHHLPLLQKKLQELDFPLDPCLNLESELDCK